VPGEPACAGFLQQGEVMEFVPQFAPQIFALREGAEFGWCELMPLQFAEQPAQLPGETRSACAFGKQFQLAFMPHEQGAQDHDAAFVVQLFRRRDVQFFKDKLRKALEGENLQARVAVERRVGKQLAFELESGLFGCEENEWRALGIFFERGSDFGEAAEGLAAAGGAEEKSRLHDSFSRKGAKAQR